MTKNTVLYFEGAGMNYETNEHSNVENYRVRTSFYNNEGVQYYIELGRTIRYNAKGKVETEWALRIDHLFKVAERFDHDKRLGSYEIKTNHIAVRQLDYTNEAITKWINENLNCSFDTVQVLNDFYGYRVHSDNEGYNVMENVEINVQRATARKEAYNKIDMEYRSLLNEKYSIITMNEMDQNSITIKCHASDTKLRDIPRIVQIVV
jgi:hypothetical protein